MKKNKFLKQVFILIIGGIFTKILGMVIRIITSRVMGKTGIGIYSFIMPTFMLGISISQIGFTSSISKLVAEEKRRSKKLILGVIPISLGINFLLLLFFVIFGKYISIYLLHDSRCTYGVMAIGFVLPFISISSILRGYFFGKERMGIHVISNIFEDVIRIIFLVIFLPIFKSKSIKSAVVALILSNILSELTSIFIFLIFLPKSKINIKDFLISHDDFKSIFSIGIPLTGSRIIGNIGGFLEPIILSFILIKVGYSSSFIVEEYGVINGFVLPILLLPSFFSTAIAQAIIPQVSKGYVNKMFNSIKRKIKLATFLSFFIGFCFTILVFLFPSVFLNFLYNTNDGVNYLRLLAPIFLFQYIQGPISASLQAMGKSRISFNATLIGTVVKIICLVLFSLFKIGLYGLIIGFSLSILVTTFYEVKSIKKVLKY